MRLRQKQQEKAEEKGNYPSQEEELT